MSTDTTPTEPRHPFTKPGFIVSAVAMVILAMALILVAVTGGRGEDNYPQVGPFAGPACDLPASDRTSIVGPPEAGWIGLSTSVSIPQHPEHGPATTVDDGVHACYAQSPEGAVFAAMNMVALDLVGDSHAMLTHLTVDSPERKQLLNGTPADRPHVPGDPRLVGYNLIDYTSEAATVEVIIRDESNTAGVTMDLVREGDAWKFDPPSSMEPPARAIGNSDSFTALSEGE